nr:uncharacterized protein LOC129526884 [Gorilla gorilla gorilla]
MTLSSGFQRPQRRNKVLSQLGKLRTDSVSACPRPRNESEFQPILIVGPAEKAARVAPASPGVLNRSPVRARPGRAPGLQDGVPRPAHLRPRAGGEEASLGMNGALFVGSRGYPLQARPAQQRLYARGMEMSLRPCPRSPIPFPARG